MKRKDLLLLTFLLTQTAPVWAMWSAEDEKEMNAKGNGLPRTSVQHKELVPFLPPSVNTLDPSDPLPKNLGTAQQKVSCVFGKNPPIEITLPTEYPLHGQWVFQEDRDNTQNIATLKLSALLNKKEWKVAFKRQVAIQHQLVKSEKEVPGDNYFDGDRVYKARTKLQRWKNPTTGKEYDRTLAIRDCDVLHHEGYTVIYVEPFALGGDPSKPKDEYRGEYKFIHDLQDTEKLPGKSGVNLLYSDGKDIYFPHISQELWNKNGSQAGFFIASYKKTQCLNFITGTTIQGGKLAEGLYQLLSVQDEPKKRIEKWQKLGDDPKVIDITAPAGVSSIPGMGGYAPRIVSDDTFLLKTLKLQQNIEDIIKKTDEAKSLYPHAKGSVIVLGKTGSGKTTLINGLAGGLNAQEDGDGILRLYANNLLPGFHIGHDLVVGTKVPSVWHDPVHDILYWDCPGFGDVRGPEADIVNAFAINRLFTNANVKVVLIAQDSDLDTDIDKGQGFLKLLEEMTQLFTNEQQLKDSLSLVVTKGTDIAPDKRLKILQKKVLSAGTGIKLTDKSKNILSFLHTAHSRVNALPKPQKEGSYTVSNTITTSIGNTTFIPNPQVNFKAGIRAEAALLAGEYGQALDQYLTNYMKTEGVRQIINHCTQKIDKYAGALGDLRTEFKKLIGTLENLPIDSKTNFVNGLKKYIDVGEINKTLGNLRFLQTIKGSIKCSLADWKTALLDNVRDKIKTLITEPKVEFTSNALYLKGMFIGMGDVKNALSHHPTAQNVNIFALNRLFLEDSFTKPGVSFSCLAPQWKVLKPLTIDLSGSHGQAGANASTAGGNGQPGGPGANGGNFFGLVDVIDASDKLTINTSGGNGGKGGNGSKGADGASGAKGADGANGARGADGANGNPGIKGGIAENGTDGSPGQPGQPGHAGGTGQPGKSGQRGQDGGKAGQGGLAGQTGTLEIKASLPGKNKVSKKGSVGANGIPGQGGQGGQGGPGGNGGQGGPGGNGGQGGPGGQAGIGAVKIQNKYFKDQNMPSSLDADCGGPVYISNENSDNTYWYVVPQAEDYFEIRSKWHYDRKDPSHFLNLCDHTNYRTHGAWNVWYLTPGPNGSFKLNFKYLKDRGVPSSLRINNKWVEEGMDHTDDKAYWYLTPGAYNVHPGANGANGQPGAKGANGQPGAKGPDGPSGNPGQGLNSAGLQKPAPQVSFNSGAITQAYILYTQQEAANPNVAPFIKVFPGLK